MDQTIKEEQEHLASLTPVKLKTVLGIQPMIYVPILWIILLLTIISVLVGVPTAVLSPGTRVHIRSIPSGAAVLVNNIYKGATPYTEVLKKGTYTVVVSLPSFTTHTEEITTKNIRILRNSSLRTKNIEAVLPLENTQTFIQQTTEDIASWSIVDHNKLQYFVPDTLSASLKNLDAVQNFYEARGNSSYTSDIKNTQKDIIRQALPYQNIAFSENQEPSFSFSFMQQELSTDVAVQAYKRLMQNPVKNKTLISLSGDSIYKDVNASSSTLYIDDILFLHVPRKKLSYGIQKIKTASNKLRLFLETEDALRLVNNNTKTHNAFSVTVPAFFIMSSEVTQAHYNRFLQDTSWDGTNALSPDHFSRYLQEFSPETTPYLPMRFISYYDAIVFAKWFSTKVSYLGYKAIVPNEYQWHAASLEHTQDTFIFALPDESTAFENAYKTHGKKPNFFGGVWEFTSSWYAPLPQFANFNGPQYGSEKVILGGSSITKDVPATIRNVEQNMAKTRNASIPPAWVSSYIGFRIALVPLPRQ